MLAAVLDSLLKLLHPVMPFVTETLWKTLTGGRVAGHRRMAGAVRYRAGSVAAQRIADMQKLITEVRRFRSDQGLNDRQRVPARLAGIAAAGLEPRCRGHRAGLADRRRRTGSPRRRRSRCGCRGGTVVVELDTSGTVDVAAERRRLEKDLAAAQKELAGTTAKLGNEAFLAKAPDEVVDKIRGRQQLAGEEVERITARLAGLAMSPDPARLRPRTRSRRCSRWSTCSTSAGRRPRSNRAPRASRR